MNTAAEIVAQIVLENYGPEGDPELYAAAQAEAHPAEPDTTILLDCAAWMRDLNGNGVRALMEAAVKADRAQRAPEADLNDYVVDLASGVAIKLASSRIVRNFSPELHAEDPEAIVHYAEQHGQEVR